MGLLSNRKNPVTGNSGTVSSGWTLTGTSFGPGKGPKVAAIRKEWKAPRSGDLAHRASRRPRQ
jgi:hypothetical protein